MLQMGSLQRGIRAVASPQHQELLWHMAPSPPPELHHFLQASSLFSHRAPQSVEPQLCPCTGSPALPTFDGHTET